MGKYRLAALCAALAALVASSVSASSQAERIGFQSGIDSSVNAWIAKDPGHRAAFEKLRRTLKLLAADYDARQTTPPPPPPTTTPTPTPKPALNPQTYNRGSRGQDARYCVTHDDGYRYDADGREIDGRRSGNPVPGLKPADEMDGRGPCEPDGAGHPPWPAASYLP